MLLIYAPGKRLCTSGDSSSLLGRETVDVDVVLVADFLQDGQVPRVQDKH